jgi:hypothetical protein
MMGILMPVKEKAIKDEEDLLTRIGKMIEEGKRGWSAKELAALEKIAREKITGRINAIPQKKEEREIQPSKKAVEETFNLVAYLDAASKTDSATGKKMLDRW